MAIKVGGIEVVDNNRQLKNINSVDSGSVSVLNTALNTDPTRGTLTKTFANGETASITLNQNVSTAPVVSVTKEVPQTGQSSKGAWDVDATASNYDLHNTAYATTLTPSSVAKTNISDFTDASKNFQTSTFGASPNPFFKTDGTKMYICSRANAFVYQYSLSTAWDVSTASYDNKSFSTNLQTSEGDPTDIFFKPDGTLLYVVGQGNDQVYAYSLTTAWDISTASPTAFNFMSTASQETAPRGIFFKSDGTVIYVVGGNGNATFYYTLSTAWDLSTASYTGSINTAVQDNGPNGINFNSSGTKMYLLGGSSGNGKIFQYNLTTAWDLTTASYSNNFLDITGYTSGGVAKGIALVDNDTRLYFGAGTTNPAYVHQLDGFDNAVALGTGSFASTDVGKRIQGNGGDVILTSTAGAYDTTGGSAFTDTSTIASGSWTMTGLKSAGDVNGLTITGSSVSGNYASVMDITDNYETKVTLGSTSSLGLQGFTMSPDGLYLFAVDTTNDTVHRYDFGTAWDLSTLNTTATSGQSLNVTSYDGGPVDLALNPTGTKLYVAGQDFDTIYQWNLSTAYDLSTASYSANLSVQGAIGVNGGFNGIFVTPDGTKIYTVCRNTDRVARWNFSSSQDIDSATFDSATDISATNTYPFDIAWNPDGSAMYLAGNNSGFYKFNANTAFETTSGFSQDTSFSVTVNVNAVEKFFIKPDETRIYTMYNNEISQWNIGELIQPTSQYHIGVTNASGQIDSSFWTDINSMTADQSLGDGEAYYAVSTDDRTTWSVAKASDGVRPIVRDNSGTWQYNNNQGTTVGNSLANGSYSSNFDLSTISTSSNGISEIQWVNNGNHLMVCGNTNDYVTRWNASTPYDINSLSLSQNFNVSSQEIYLTSMHMSPDGYHLYVGGNQGNDVNEYTLTTAFDLFSASFTRNPVSVGNIGAIWFKPDGTKMYTMSFNGVSVQTFNLSTAWDTSTATSQGGFNLPNSSTSGASAMVFSDDGYHLYVSFAVEDVVKHYTLSTAWDVSTVSTNPASLSYASQASNMEGLTFNSDFTEMHTGTGSTLYKYDITQTSYNTSTTWTNATTNDEFYALQQALGATEFNRMNKTQLDAVADGSHFTLGNTLDLMIALKQDTASASLPTSDGVTINYDAQALNQGAVLGTDYDFDFPANNKVRITSNAAQNLKIRVV